MKLMAQTVLISTQQNAAKIIVDGNEINDVLEYHLEEGSGIASLTLKIAITGKIEAQIE